MQMLHKNILIDLLYQPAYRPGRHLFIVAAITATTLSQSFFVFGGSPAISTGTIYFFGTGLAACTLAVIYVNIYVLAPHFLSKRAYASYLLVLLLLVTGLVFAKYRGEYAVFASAGLHRTWNGITLLDGLSNMMLYTICVASTSIPFLFRQLVSDHAEIEHLENKRLKNSIDEIKNRIQPKFLYATLGFASEKVKSEPRLVSDTLFRLSELLRYQLYDCTRSRVLLASEITFIQNYLLLHRQNSGNKFSFDLSVNGNTNRLVPPAAFTPCIEEITRHQPETLGLQMNIEATCIGLVCKASGKDFGKNDFSKTEQRLKWLNDTLFEKEADTVKINLNVVC